MLFVVIGFKLSGWGDWGDCFTADGKSGSGLRRRVRSCIDLKTGLSANSSQCETYNSVGDCQFLPGL